MKKTFNINLAGYPFIIDEDAYNLLKDYLDTIRFAFVSNDDTGELAADIESRIAEILLEKEGRHNRIVTIEEISQVIERIGKPSDFIEIEETSTQEIYQDSVEDQVRDEERPTPPPYEAPDQNQRNPFVRKKMFRDPQKAILGGVCAGLAAYLNMDVTIVRLLTVLLFFLSASTVAIVYIILWIVMPEATTPLQRMQMMGEDPTMENIGRTVADKYRSYDNGMPGSSDNEPKGFLATAVSIMVKCLIILGLIVAVPIIIVLVAALIGCIIAVFVISIGIIGGGMFDSLAEGLMVLYILLAVIGGTITIGVPIWLLIRKLWKNKDFPVNPATQRAILIVWLIGIAMVSVFTVKAVRKGRQIDRHDWKVKTERLMELSSEEDEVEAEDFVIDENGIKVIGKNGDKIIITDEGVKISKGTQKKPEENPVDSLSSTSESVIISEVTDSLTVTD